MTQDGPTLGASIFRYQTREDSALQPGQASGGHDETFCKGAKGGIAELTERSSNRRLALPRVAVGVI
jgi:hypothetical protein